MVVILANFVCWTLKEACKSNIYDCASPTYLGSWSMAGLLGQPLAYYYCARYKQVYLLRKHFQSMQRDIGMAVPKTMDTRYRDGSMQERFVMQKTTQVTPSSHLFLLQSALQCNLIT